MKQLLTLFFVTISIIGFGQEINYKTIRVKVKPQHIKKFNAQSHKRSAAGYVQTGHSKLDQLNGELEVISYSKVFSEGGLYKKRREAFGLHLWYDVTFKETSSNMFKQRLSKFKNLEEVEIAEPVYKKRLDIIADAPEPVIQFKAKELNDIGVSFLPNDPRVDEQWHYNNTGQTGGFDDADIDLPEAWNTQKGSDNVIVAIIDGGIDVSHEDLSGNIWVNSLELSGTPGVDDDGNGYIDDINGYNFADNTGPISAHNHGTHVAGTVGAETNNGIGVSGVAGGSGSDDGVRMMSVQVFSNSSQGGFAESFAYAADNGAVIAQNSWGYTSEGFYEQSVLDGIDYFIATAGYDADNNPIGPMQGGIVIFAAGNDNSDGAHYPGYYEPTLAVSSTNHNDQKSWYSNYGSWVDIAAPGGETSIISQGVLSTLPGNSYGFYQGTSMACPHVAGVAALIVSQFGGNGFTPAQLRARLVETTDYIDDKNSGYEGLLGQGRVNAAATLLVDDGIPPESIDDLSMESTRFNAIDLSWTAPADEDNGSAASYEIRYSTTIIDQENFDSAVLGAVKLANNAGASEEHTLEGLLSETTYFVAIRSSDYFGNSSLISNVITFETPEPPVISVSPLSLASDLFTGGAEIHILTISNNGTSDLIFEIGRSNALESTAKQFDNTLLSKGQTDKRVGTPVVNRQGEDGSEYGYNWKDSNEPAGPSFVWEDISSTGINLNLGDDNYALLSLPFEFEYYGKFKSDIYVSSNGFISFSHTGASSYSYNGFPNPNTPNDVVAGIWTDLNPGAGGGVYYQTESNKVIIQYDQVPLYSAGGSYTFQIILYENGEIRIQYLSLSSVLTSFSTGIENSDGTEGMTIAFNTAYLENELAILVSNSGSLGLEFEPDFGLVGAGESIDVLVDVNASGLIGGVYEETIKVFSNDPLNPVVDVDLTVNVTGAPDLDLDKNEFDFGDIFIGGTLSDSVLVTNGGTDILHITSITNSESEFIISRSDLSLNPEESAYVHIQFAPTLTGIVNDVLVFESNDPDFSVINIPLVGNGVEPPIVDASPSSFTASLFTGESESQELLIANNGASNLNVSIAPRTFNADLTSNKPKKTPILKSVDYSFQDSSIKKEQHPSTTIKNNFIETLSDSIVIYTQDFESGATDWSHYSVDGAIDNWSLTTVRSNSGSYSYNVAQHDSQGSDALESPWINLDETDELILAFSHWYQFDDCSDPNFEVDGVIIELSTDGTNWMKLDPISGYPYVLDDECSNPIAGEEAYSHSNGEFTVELVDLSDYAGESVQVRFLAGWDCGNCAFNEGWYLDDFVIYNSASWLNVSQREFSIPPGMSTSVDVLFDASGLFGGVYDGDLQLVSNDPITPEILLPVTLNVTGAPDIDLDASSIDFGEVFLSATSMDSVQIVNTGTDVLEIANVLNSEPDFELSMSSLSLSPGEGTYLYVTFTPTSAGEITGQIEIQSNDVDESSVFVDLVGVGLEPPIIAVDPSSLTSNLLTGETEDQVLAISNNGMANLDYNITVINNSYASLSIKSKVQKNIIVEDIASSAQQKENNEPVTNSGEYSGEYLTFGISNYGEIMPFQYLSGNEHLAVGGYVSGYSIVYELEGADNIAYAAYQNRNGFVPHSYEEIENSDTRTEVNVIVRTTDGMLEVQRNFVFKKYAKSVSVNTSIRNLTSSTLGAVVFKAFADWDVDADYADDNWNVDLDRNMIYAYDESYVSIATFDLPDYVDMDGWEDFSRRLTDENVLGEVLGFDGFELLHYELGDLNIDDQKEIKTAFAAGDNLEDLQEQVDAASSYGWLSILPSNGTVIGSEAQDIEISFDATGLYGGVYTADIEITTNDPLNPQMIVPVTLNVTGAPDIEVEELTLDFGDVFVGISKTDSILVSNLGTDVLNISNITNGLTEYVISIDDLTLDPLETTYIRLSYNPTSASVNTDVIEILSDDSDESLIEIDLIGTGIQPPAIEVNPLDVTSNLYSGESEVQTITISNTGVADLNYSLVSSGYISDNDFQMLDSEVDRSNSSVNSSDDIIEAVNSINSSILVIQNTTEWGLDMQSYIMANFGISSTVIGYESISSTNFNSYDLIITLGDQIGSYYDAISTNVTKFEDFVSNGGIVQYQLATQGSNVSIVDGVQVIYGSQENFNVFVDGTHPVVKNAVNPLEGSSANHAVISNLPASTTIITQTQDSDEVTTAEYKYGSGTVLVTGMTWGFLVNNNYPAGILLNNTLDYLINELNTFIDINPIEGVITAGQSVEIDLTIDASNLNGGIYESSIIVSSNDPANAEIIVPITLNVTGTPDIYLDDNSIDFGEVFLSGASMDSLRIVNTGTDVLEISDILNSGSNFELSIGTMSLSPGEGTYLYVTFTPTSAGEITDQIEIQSNDIDESSVFVDLVGVGLELPIIIADPASLTSNLNIDQSEIKEILITNTGGSPLLYDLILENVSTSDLKVLSRSLGFVGTERSKEESSKHDTSAIENQSISSNDIQPMNLGTLSSLEVVLGSLELINSDLVDLIPNRYNFSGGVSGSTISDGGGDMYDGGNALLTNLGGNFNYSDKLITSTPYLNGQDYFTAKYDGLFVFASDLNNNSEFIIEGNLGADGGGSVDASILNLEISGRSFLGFVKRVYGTSDPSVNHLIIVEDSGTLGHEFSTDSDNDFHRVYGLEGSQRLYYLLFAGTNGGYINDSEILSIMESFVSSVDKAQQILLVSPSSGSIAPGATEIIAVEFNSYGASEGTYGAELIISGQDEHIEIVNVPLTLNVALDAYPEISVGKTLVDFSEVQIGTIKHDTVAIRNNGTSILNIEGLTSVTSSFSYSLPDIDIAPGEESKLVITFEPNAIGSYSDVLNIVSNDPINSSKFVSVRGEVIGSPDIQIDADSFHKEIVYSKLDSIEFIISNDGASQLEANLLGGDMIVIGDEIRNMEIQAGSSRKVVILIDATGFEIDNYESYVRVISNDPKKGLIDIPIIIDVISGALISVASQIDFGSAHVMDVRLDSVFVYNEGDSDLQISDIQVDNEAFIVSVKTNTISSGDSTLLNIEFAPNKEGSFEGQVLINSNASNTSSFNINLFGSGYCAAPVIIKEIGQLDMFENEEEVLILTEFFNDVNERQLSFSGFEFDASLLNISIAGDQLTINSTNPGLSEVSFNIDNGLCDPIHYLFTVNVDEITSVFGSDNLSQVFRLYPNPAGDEISIKFYNNNDITSDGKVVITDITGKKVLTMSISSMDDLYCKIDISSLESSLYFIELHQGDNVFRERFIKK